MFKTLLRLFRRDATSRKSQFDPIYGLPNRAVNDWLHQNPDLKEVYKATLRARSLRRGMANSALRTGTSRVPKRDVSERPSRTSNSAAVDVEASESMKGFIESSRHASPKSTWRSRTARFDANSSQQMCVL
jgi:hypothetical protein